MKKNMKRENMKKDMEFIFLSIAMVIIDVFLNISLSY